MTAVLLLLLLPAPQLAGADAALARGEKVFAQSCSVGYCHGAAGAAGRGPRLAGRTFSDDFLDRVIRKGVPNSAMPGFELLLPAADLDAVIAYVKSIASTSPAAVPPHGAAATETSPAEAAPVFQGPPEAALGRDLFFAALKNTRCSTCHQMEGRGDPVGPLLTAAAANKPEEWVQAMRRSTPKAVRMGRLESGDSFPAVPLPAQGGLVRLYDLTVPPPVLRTLTAEEFGGWSDNARWSHAEAVSHYTEGELRSVANYLYWMKTQASAAGAAPKR